MSHIPRCNYAGTPGQQIPTRSFGSLVERLLGLLSGWLRR